MRPKIRRRQYLIQVKFQLKYVAYILFFLYLGAIIAGYTVYWTAWVSLGEKLANVYPRGRLVYIYRTANWTLFWRLVFLTPVFVIIGTLLSHRIAGPVYRISRYVDGLRKGDYTKSLKLRKNDELKGLAHRVDRLCTKLREDHEERSRVLEELNAKVRDGKASPEILKSIEKLEKVV